MEELQAYMCIAKPHFVFGSPAPHTVCKLSTKSTLSAEDGKSNGFHRICISVNRLISFACVKCGFINLVGIGLLFAPIVRDVGVLEQSKRVVTHGWSNSIEPRSCVFSSRCRKRRTGQLLGVQTIRTYLRTVLSFWQRVRTSGIFGRKLWSETAHVLQFVFVSLLEYKQ